MQNLEWRELMIMVLPASSLRLGRNCVTHLYVLIAIQQINESNNMVCHSVPIAIGSSEESQNAYPF
jgi:hypothetical protein